MKSYPPYLKNKAFTIPYNNDPALTKKMGKLLSEPRPFDVYIYFAPNPFLTNAGRKFPNLERYLDKSGKFEPKKFDKQLISALKEAKKHNFRTNLLLNNILLGMPHFNHDLKRKTTKIQKYLEKLNSKGCLDRVTIANPYLLELINWTRLDNVEIKTSVNFQIKSPKTIELLNNLSKFWLRKPLNSIEIQKDLLRNLTALGKIRKKVGKKIKLSVIVNEGCLVGCPYQIAHQLYAFSFPVQKRHPRIKEELLFEIAKCKYLTNREPWRVLDANWVLPSHIKHYEGLVDEFKLTDRSDTTEGILKTIKAYVFDDYDKENIAPLISLLRMESFVIPEGLLPKNFFQKVTSGKEIPVSYFKKIWAKIESHNIKLGNIPRAMIKDKVKESLHKYIGNK